ncbi:LmeA family phospholipid-binding protein [Streptomyces sp. YKOK-J1]
MKHRTSTIRTRLRRHRAAKIAAGAVLLTVALTGVGELAARSIIQDRITKAAPSLGDATVGEGGDWALWDLADQRIPRLDVSSDDAHLGRLSPVSVKARLDDVHLGDRPTIGSTHVRVTVLPEAIATAIRTAAPSVQVASVTTDPASGTVRAAVGPAGGGRLTLQPVLKDGKVSVTVNELTLFGRTIPADRLGMTEGALGTAPVKDYPLGLKATGLRVLPDTLEITLTGGPTILPGPH